MMKFDKKMRSYCDCIIYPRYITRTGVRWSIDPPYYKERSNGLSIAWFSLKKSERNFIYLGISRDWFFFPPSRNKRGLKSIIVQSEFWRDASPFCFCRQTTRNGRDWCKTSHSAIRQDNLTTEFGDVEVLLFIECHIIDLFRIKTLCGKFENFGHSLLFWDMSL